MTPTESTGATDRLERGHLRVVDQDAIAGAPRRADPAAFLDAWRALEAAGSSGADRLRLAFRSCHGMVYAVASRITGSSWDAEDVTQSVFEEFSRRMHEIRHPAAIPSFLKTVAVRTSLRRVRRDRWRQRRLRIAYAPVSSGMPTSPEDAASVRQLLAALDPDQRAAVVLKYVEMNSHDEVAALMGVSAATARRRLEAGRRRLVELIGEDRVRAMFGGDS